jgi:hypothetical protein
MKASNKAPSNAALLAELCAAEECAARARRRARRLRAELRERGALPNPKRPPKPRRPPAPGTRRHGRQLADLDLARRALRGARGRELLPMRTAVAQLERGTREALSPKQRQLAVRCARRVGAPL